MSLDPRVCIACTITYEPVDEQQKHCSKECKRYMIHLRSRGVQYADYKAQRQREREIPWAVEKPHPVYGWAYVLRYGELFARVDVVEELVEWWMKEGRSERLCETV